MPGRKKNITPFNLSFLDIMFCGFGAVVLLVLLINANTVSTRKEIHEDLRSEVTRLNREVQVGRDHLVELKNSLRDRENEVVTARGKSNEILATIRQLEMEIADFRNLTLAKKEHINQLVSEMKSLDEEQQRLAGEITARQQQGTKVRRFEGEGNRQYLTGLKLGGKRVLLLVDTSASMLDETIVNVLRRRNLDAETKKQSPKWLQARKAVEWLVANLPTDSTLQIYGFNTEPRSLLPGSREWKPVTDGSSVNEMIAGLRSLVPEKGTSLENVFALVKTLQPRPDNILLITDGLPTQGKRKPLGTTVSGEKRVKYFERAVKVLPQGIPVNTLLYPMEGDPMAPVLYWKLAVDTGGSFLTPSRDWP